MGDCSVDRLRAEAADDAEEQQTGRITSGCTSGATLSSAPLVAAVVTLWVVGYS